MKNMKIKILISILTILTFSSCSEINTTNSTEIYKYWSGTNAHSELELLNGQYWQSSHWTREYIMYLKFKPSDKWWNEFILKNQISTDKGDWIMPSDAPTWFNPSGNSIRFVSNSDFDQGSRYFKDTLTGVCYIYEIQL
jgi:hypothetical protein